MHPIAFHQAQLSPFATTTFDQEQQQQTYLSPPQSYQTSSLNIPSFQPMASAPNFSIAPTPKTFYDVPTASTMDDANLSEHCRK